jgi:hypothetical protein
MLAKRRTVRQLGLSQAISLLTRAERLVTAVGEGTTEMTLHEISEVVGVHNHGRVSEVLNGKR